MICYHRVWCMFCLLSSRRGWQFSCFSRPLVTLVTTCPWQRRNGLWVTVWSNQHIASGCQHLCFKSQATSAYITRNLLLTLIICSINFSRTDIWIYFFILHYPFRTEIRSQLVACCTISSLRWQLDVMYSSDGHQSLWPGFCSHLVHSVFSDHFVLSLKHTQKQPSFFCWVVAQIYSVLIGKIIN